VRKQPSSAAGAKSLVLHVTFSKGSNRRLSLISSWLLTIKYCIVTTVATAHLRKNMIKRLSPTTPTNLRVRALLCIPSGAAQINRRATQNIHDSVRRHGSSSCSPSIPACAYSFPSVRHRPVCAICCSKLIGRHARPA